VKTYLWPKRHQQCLSGPIFIFSSPHCPFSPCVPVLRSLIIPSALASLFPVPCSLIIPLPLTSLFPVPSSSLQPLHPCSLFPHHPFAPHVLVPCSLLIPLPLTSLFPIPSSSLCPSHPCSPFLYCPFAPHILVPYSLIIPSPLTLFPHCWLLAPVIHPMSSGLQGWGQVLGCSLLQYHGHGLTPAIHHPIIHPTSSGLQQWPGWV